MNLNAERPQLPTNSPNEAKIKEGLSAAELVILILSQRSVARPWVNFEAGAAWLVDKKLLPVCYGNLSKDELPHPYSAIQALNLPSDAYYLLKSATHQLNLKAISSPAVHTGALCSSLGKGSTTATHTIVWRTR